MASPDLPYHAAQQCNPYAPATVPEVELIAHSPTFSGTIVGQVTTASDLLSPDNLHSSTYLLRCVSRRRPISGLIRLSPLPPWLLVCVGSPRKDMASGTRGQVPGTPRVISPSPTPSESGDQINGGYFGPITRSASKRVVSPSAIDEENEVDDWDVSDSGLERSRTRSRSPVLATRRRRKSGFTTQKPAVAKNDGEAIVLNGKSNGHLVPPRTISSYWREISRSPSPLGLIPIHRHWRSFVSSLLLRARALSPLDPKLIVRSFFF